MIVPVFPLLRNGETGTSRLSSASQLEREAGEGRGLSVRVKILMGAVVVAVVAAGGATYALVQDSGTTETTVCDYAEHYTAAATLAAHSDVVVAGRVRQKVGATSGSGGGGTDFAFVVSSVLSDPGKRLPPGGGTVTVHQSGTSGGTACSDDPLFTKGSQAVLFLREYAPGSFVVVGGPNGRLDVRDGQVFPFNEGSLQFTGSLDALTRTLRVDATVTPSGLQ